MDKPEPLEPSSNEATHSTEFSTKATAPIEATSAESDSLKPVQAESRKALKSTEGRKKRKRPFVIGSIVAALGVTALTTGVLTGAIPLGSTTPQAPGSYRVGVDQEPCEALALSSTECVVTLKKNNEVPRGELVSQSPAAGSKHFKTELELIYSAGPLEAKLPDVTGKDYGAAVEELYLSGAEVGEVKKVANSDYEVDRVISMSQEPGTAVVESKAVDLEVASDTIEVPDFKGSTQEKAVFELDRLGFDVEVIEENSKKTVGTVLSQTPSKKEVIRGSKVTLRIAKDESPEKVKVPKVVSLSEDEAQATLAAAGFKRISVIRVESSKVTESKVTQVSPGEEQLVRNDSNIVLVVSTPEAK